MFTRKCLITRLKPYRILVLNSNNYTKKPHARTLTDINGIYYKNSVNLQAKLQNKFLVSNYSKNVIEDVSKEDNHNCDNEINEIKELFSQPRVTLNEFAAKVKDKVFDVHYKQTVIAPKGVKKKPIQNDWTCTYAFVWPEKIKFENTSLSKRQAAEKSAFQAVQWLYKIKKIDKKGCPIYDKSIINELQSSFDKNIHVTMSDSSMEKINKIWSEYQNDIKNIYDATFKEEKLKLLKSSHVLRKDSTIDDNDFAEDISQDESDKILDISDNKFKIHPVFGRPITVSETALQRRERTLRQTFNNYDENLVPLPIDKYVRQITSKLEENRVLVIVGAAGCGKSTRVPAAILRHFGAKAAAIVSEPRRVAAIGLARRVADELGEQVGESIGYQVRLQSKLPRPPGGAVLFCTSGVLLRRLQIDPGLEGCTHVCIDEAHERDVNTDVVLLLLKKALDLNPELKIIVMSATLDVEVFTNYFDDCTLIEVPGRKFPVDVSYLEDIQNKFNVKLPSTMEYCKADGRPQINCQEIVEVIKAVDKTQKEGAILVFLPGWAEIKQTQLLLDDLYEKSNLHVILPVHSRLSTDEQTKMFAQPPPGVRKIVLSTNIAETSVTIPDVIHVIDSGAFKENRIREGTGTASLDTVWVSQAAAKQRAGRAGRVQPGHCYRLYTKEKEAEFSTHTTPEILRIPLEQTVLDCKSYAQNERIQDFLAQLPEPPSNEAIRIAVSDLIDLGALTPSQQLTRLGSMLSSMTLHPRLARCVLNSAILGCILAVADMVTYLDTPDLFRNAAERREEIRAIKRKYSATSDHVALHHIQDEYERILREQDGDIVDIRDLCAKHGLREDRLKYVRSVSNLYMEQVLKTGVIETNTEIDEINRFSDIDVFIPAVLLSGSNSMLNVRKYVKTKGKLMTSQDFYTSKGEKAHIGSESVNYGIKKRNQNTLVSYFGGFHSTERRALVVHKTSVISPHTVLLFSTGDVDDNVKDDESSEITELHVRRHRLKITIPSSEAETILKAREMLWKTLQYYVERDLNNVTYEHLTNTLRFKTKLMKAIGRILVEGDKEYVQKCISHKDR